MVPTAIGRLWCDCCNREARKPAISIALNVYCTSCADEMGMFPGEYGTAHTYDQWKALAFDAQRHTREAT